MKQFQKKYYKVIGLFTAIVFFTNTASYGLDRVSTVYLRVPICSDDIHRTREAGLRLLLKSLRPEIGKNVKLNGREFEEYLRELDKKLSMVSRGNSFSSYTIEKIGMLRLFSNSIEEMKKTRVTSDYLGFVLVFLKMICQYHCPSFGYSYRKNKYVLSLNRKTLSLIPLFVSLSSFGLFFLLPSPASPIWNMLLLLTEIAFGLVYGTLGITNLISSNDSIFRHELKHLYIKLIFDFLCIKGIINSYNRTEIQGSLGCDDGLPMWFKENITNEALGKIEEEIVEAVLPHVNVENIPKENYGANKLFDMGIEKIKGASCYSSI